MSTLLKAQDDCAGRQANGWSSLQTVKCVKKHVLTHGSILLFFQAFLLVMLCVVVCLLASGSCGLRWLFGACKACRMHAERLDDACCADEPRRAAGHMVRAHFTYDLFLPCSTRKYVSVQNMVGIFLRSNWLIRIEMCIVLVWFIMR